MASPQLILSILGPHETLLEKSVGKIPTVFMLKPVPYIIILSFKGLIEYKHKIILGIYSRY
jgi:hypothetical protein